MYGAQHRICVSAPKVDSFKRKRHNPQDPVDCPFRSYPLYLFLGFCKVMKNPNTTHSSEPQQNDVTGQLSPARPSMYLSDFYPISQKLAKDKIELLESLPRMVKHFCFGWHAEVDIYWHEPEIDSYFVSYQLSLDDDACHQKWIESRNSRKKGFSW